jgi:hypothetical protein
MPLMEDVLRTIFQGLRCHAEESIIFDLCGLCGVGTGDNLPSVLTT